MRTKDMCWSVGTIYDSKGLPGVSTAGPGIGRGVTSGKLTKVTDIAAYGSSVSTVYGFGCFYRIGGMRGTTSTTRGVDGVVTGVIQARRGWTDLGLLHTRRDDERRQPVRSTIRWELKPSEPRGRLTSRKSREHLGARWVSTLWPV